MSNFEMVLGEKYKLTFLRTRTEKALAYQPQYAFKHLTTSPPPVVVISSSKKFR